MDLALATRVLYRHKLVVGVGILLAIFLAVISFYRVSLDFTGPTLTPRKAEIWQSDATIFLTEPGFPAGRRVLDQFNSPGAFAGNAALFARLAQSDQVRALAQKDGPLPGLFQAFPAADPLTRDSPLPMVTLLGKASSPGAAVETVSRGLDAFLAYVRGQQASAKIPEAKRIQLRVVNAPSRASLIQPRKKTLPIVVFLAVTIAAIALAFILENLGWGRQAVLHEARQEPEPEFAPVAKPARVSVREPDLSTEQAPVRAREPEPVPEPVARPVPEPVPEPVAEPEPESVTAVRRWA